MKTTLTFLLLALPNLAFTQTVNNVNLNELDVEYIEVVPYRKPFNNKKVYLLIDYGQQIEIVAFVRPESSKVKDENGQELVFNSDVDCLNFMSKFGYELFTKTEKVSEGISYSVYLLRKKRKINKE